MNKNWGEFAILMLTGVGIATTGIFSESTINTTAAICSTTALAPVIKEGPVSAVTAASTVAIGAGVSIVLFALSNKFDLLSTPGKRSVFMMILAACMITIGSISLSIRGGSDDDTEEKLLAQSRLGGIVLGFGLGIILISIPKLIVSLAGGGKQTNDAHLTKVNQITVAGSTATMTLFATIIGSWSWNIYGKCKKQTPDDPMEKELEKKAADAAMLNGIATVVSALLCVYAGVYFGFRVAGSPIADTLSNFKKAHTAVFPLKGK